MSGLTLTVAQLNEYVRRSLASDPLLHGVCVTGEISNLKAHSSGHWYFTLKDEEAAINCALFRSSARMLRFRPQNGQRVRAVGSVGLYPKTGAYQLYVDSMEPDGIGDLYARFEELKRRLREEGLFDAERKKDLPFLPRGIGIVTSRTGAVVHDIARVVWRRFPGMPLYLCPVKVQGEGAAQEIARGIRLLDTFPGADVLIVGRGGGSMEDLWAFNEEVVARAIADCAKPVISAVGHETDVTICDFAADVRAATPSAAAELAVPEMDALQMEIAMLRDRIEQAALRGIAGKRLVLTTLTQRLASSSPAGRSARLRAELSARTARVESAMKAALANARHRADSASVRIRASGPMETMRRGYAVVLKNDALVRSAQQLSAGDEITLVLADGRAAAEITREVCPNGSQEAQNAHL